MGLNYNQFMESHKKLRSTAMENLRVEWQPEMIMFADGTALSLQGEQTYSIENNLPKSDTNVTNLPNNPAEAAAANETIISEKKPQTKKTIQKNPTSYNSLAENETMDKDKSDDNRKFDNFDTATKEKPKTSTPSIIKDDKPMVIRMPDGRMKIVNQ